MDLSSFFWVSVKILEIPLLDADDIGIEGVEEIGEALLVGGTKSSGLALEKDGVDELEPGTYIGMLLELSTFPSLPLLLSLIPEDGVNFGLSLELLLLELDIKSPYVPPLPYPLCQPKIPLFMPEFDEVGTVLFLLFSYLFSLSTLVVPLSVELSP